MKPYACLTVCLLLTLAVVLTPSPGASAFSIHLGSTDSGAGGLGAPSPRAHTLREASTFWRRRRRGSTYGSPGSSAAEMNLMTPRWGFRTADDEGSKEANHWKKDKQEKLRAKLNRWMRSNDILGLSTPSKFHLRDPFEEAAASSPFSKVIRQPYMNAEHQGRRWQKTQSDRQHAMPRLETSSTDDSRTSLYEDSNDRTRDDVGDFEDMAAKIREAIDMLAESKGVRESEEEVDQEDEYGARAELPNAFIPSITTVPKIKEIPAPPVQSREPARQHEEQSEKAEHPVLLQREAADPNDPLLVFDKAASKPFFSESLDLGTRMVLPKASSSEKARSDYGDLFHSDSSNSLFGGLGGTFDTDDSDCETIETKTCFSDEGCSCGGYYRCQGRHCVLRSETKSSDLTSGVADFSDVGTWRDGPIQTRIKRQHPVHPASAEAAAKATAKSSKAGKQRVATDRPDSQTAASHSLRKRKAQAASDDSAVHAALAAADTKGVKRRVPVGDPSLPPAPSSQ